MEFEWDGDKAATNLKKHEVDFADAVAVLFDEMSITIRDETPDEEERFITLGADAVGRLLVVVYTWRGEVVRLVSARKATAVERRGYENKR